MKAVLALVLSASLFAISGVAVAQDAVGNGQPQAKTPKAPKLTAEQCAARAADPAASAMKGAKAQDRYCKRLMKKQQAK
jgi:hypothetical protein